MATILVVDDDAQIRRMFNMALELAGHTVVEAANGDEGLRQLECADVDVVITDIVMPEKEGLETIISIRRTYPSMPVIAISGGGRTNPFTYLASARQLGADYIFIKPVDTDELVRVVGQFAEKGRKAMEENQQ